jgi:hypothetical protein
MGLFLDTNININNIASLNQFGNGPSPPTPLPERERGAIELSNSFRVAIILKYYY